MALTKAIIVLSGSKQAKKLGDSVKRASEQLAIKSKTKSIDIKFAHKDYDYITVIKSLPKTANKARKLGGSMYNKFKDVANEIHFDINTKHMDSINEGMALSSYNFDKYKTDPRSVEFSTEDSGISKSVNFARDLVSEPGNVLYPAEYARRINEQLSPLGVTVKIYHQAQLEEMGLNLLLSVGQGSEKDSYVVVMEYMKGAKEDAPFALVGKGVTFDTGGISLKPGRNMGDMKYDMGGSAAVVGALHAIASENIKKNVVGIVGLVENMPDGTAIKPGDVVTSLSGQTVENLNTDAEGRLVLADILTYVQNEYKPSAIINLATLTGAIVATLGHEMAGLFTNSNDLEKAIKLNGKKVDEEFFRMPMGKNWNKMIDSDIADMQNIGGAYGGSTTAAEFLYRFVDKKTPWAHLDIAGMAWAKKGSTTTPKGAAGFGVQTLFNIIANEKIFWYNIDEDMNY
jgi:leucyl aminopeptidase